jgi:hypothetical protein
MESTIYKGHEIEKHAGWFVCFMQGVGFLRSDTMRGLKALIAEAEKGA